MAGNFKLNNKGFFEIRKGAPLIALEEKIAQKIADECNAQAGIEDGYRTSSLQGASKPQGRWRTTVIAVTPEAVRDNAKNNRILKCLEAGRF